MLPTDLKLIIDDDITNCSMSTPSIISQRPPELSVDNYSFTLIVDLNEHYKNKTKSDVCPIFSCFEAGMNKIIITRHFVIIFFLQIDIVERRTVK